MRGLFNNPRLALEQVEFQDGSFFRELTRVFADLKKLKTKQIPESGLYDTLSAVIRKHTNFNITVVESPFGPSIQLPTVDRNHPLLQGHAMKWLGNGSGKRLLAETEGVVKGGVDLRSGKVSGIWTQLPATLLMPASLIGQDFWSAEEFAAVTLHEVGHYFVYCEFITHTLTTNHVLQEMARELDGSDTPEKREAVLISVKEALKLKNLDAALLAKTQNNKVVETVVISGVQQRLRSELGSSFYDAKGFEALADQYASRQGAGRYLVSSLDKLYRDEQHRSYLSLPTFLFYEALKLLLLINPLTMGFMIISGTMGLMELGAVHETPEARMKRVRNDIVQALKNPKLTNAAYKALKEDLEVVDRLAAQVTDRRTLYQTLLMALGNSNQWDQMTLQKQLEALATNDLFVKAQEFKRLDLK